LFFGTQGAQDGAAHDGFGGAAAGPDLPLGDALGEKHVYAGHGCAAAAFGQFQQVGLPWTVDEIHNNPTV
jgi:hypothetical protein